MHDENENPIAWIETIDPENARDDLKEIYDANTDPQHGVVDHILQIHSLHPRSLRDHLQLYKTLMFGPSPLPRAQREMIGVVVSAINDCVY